MADFVTRNPELRELLALAERAARTEASILITGESGTGKNRLARRIHDVSERSEGPYVEVPCANLPPELLESELFGHQKGAFTDAKETKKGRLELAHGGTLFLDEIGEIGMRMQIDLLRVLEDRVFYRVGGTQPIEADFRVIAATNRDLRAAVELDIFREDLYYRLNVVSFHMPRLSERKEDIPLLAEHFLQRFTQETNKPIDAVTRQAMDEMMLYDWPGNVRELENAIERAVVVGKERKIHPEDLPFYCLVNTPPVGQSLKEVEKQHIRQILEENDWNVARSAKILQIDRSTLYSKIKRHRLQRSD